MNNPFEKIDIRLSNIENLLLDLKHQSLKPESGQQDLVPIEEAMKITNMARQTLYGKVYDRKIPFVKREGTRKLFFSRKALLEWLQETEK